MTQYISHSLVREGQYRHALMMATVSILRMITTTYNSQGPFNSAAGHFRRTEGLENLDHASRPHISLAALGCRCA